MSLSHCCEEKGGSHDLTEELLDSMRVVDQQKEQLGCSCPASYESYKGWSLCFGVMISIDCTYIRCLEAIFASRKGNDAYRSQQWALAKDCYDLAIAADALRMDIEPLHPIEHHLLIGFKWIII